MVLSHQLQKNGAHCKGNSVTIINKVKFIKLLILLRHFSFILHSQSSIFRFCFDLWVFYLLKSQLDDKKLSISGNHVRMYDIPAFTPCLEQGGITNFIVRRQCNYGWGFLQQVRAWWVQKVEGWWRQHVSWGMHWQIMSVLCPSSLTDAHTSNAIAFITSKIQYDRIEKHIFRA